ncbi:CREB/ATF bZIP transcription factor [Rana temporaria]|uniref:CREB/ATF bZIP transcription factor n=1 Tax=Rana temporaria TaxID=8407 RepID=UPI001AAD9537|nr:CREB/ATF bZIP transcription factor [Rana temporaria]
MRRPLRERAQPTSGTTRKRKLRSVEAEEDESLVTDLGELLCADGEAAAWWTEDVERPADSSLADLLQQLAACEEAPEAELRRHDPAEAVRSSAPPDTLAASDRRGAPRGDNRNALAARLNRLRKKEYVSGLEGKVARLSEDNQRLERDNRGLEERVRHLEEETRYLRAVLANDSALSQLLGRLTGLGGVKLSTSLFGDQKRKKAAREHDYALPAEERATPVGGGVCLHVDKEKVSVEFCPACSRSAADNVGSSI